MKGKENVDHVIKVYSRAKVGEYELDANKLSLPKDHKLKGHRLFPHFSMLKIKDAKLKERKVDLEDPLRSVYWVNKKYVDKLHPDKIDVRYFWKTVMKNFKYFPIHGGVVSSIEELNDNSNKKLAEPIKAIAVVDSVMNMPNSKMLEIGPGYGNIYNHVKNSGWDDRYYSIDVNPLFDHPNMLECDGRNIPVGVPIELDLVYSINVFQHLSKSQRTSYYKQAHVILKEGGYFMFSMFSVWDDNRDVEQLWALKDIKDRRYTHFFSQMTEVDELEDTIKELKDIGFKVQVARHAPNCAVFLCTKE